MFGNTEKFLRVLQNARRKPLRRPFFPSGVWVYN